MDIDDRSPTIPTQLSSTTTNSLINSFKEPPRALDPPGVEKVKNSCSKASNCSLLNTPLRTCIVSYIDSSLKLQSSCSFCSGLIFLKY